MTSAGEDYGRRACIPLLLQRRGEKLEKRGEAPLKLLYLLSIWNKLGDGG